MDPKVTEQIEKAKNWKPEILALRAILLATELEEALKWYQPCYNYKGVNLIIIGSFKNYCVLSFFKGVLLKDEKKLLVFPGPNSQTAKILKFTSLAEIHKATATIKAYIKETIALEKSGAKVILKKITAYERPIELDDIFKKDKAFKDTFEKLTPGKQRSYLLHFNGAKQAATRIARIEKCMPKIFEGKGFQDY